MFNEATVTCFDVLSQHFNRGTGETTNTLFEMPVSGLRFEPLTFQTRSFFFCRNSVSNNHSLNIIQFLVETRDILRLLCVGIATGRCEGR